MAYVALLSGTPSESVQPTSTMFSDVETVSSSVYDARYIPLGTENSRACVPTCVKQIYPTDKNI